MRYFVFFLSDYWIFLLVIRYVYQYGYFGVVVIIGKIRRKFWILKVNKLSKFVKFKCGFCCEMVYKVEMQLMIDFFVFCLVLYILVFYYIVCDYFGFYNVKIGRSKMVKYYGVIFMCLNIRVVYLELVVDFIIMEFM